MLRSRHQSDKSEFLVRTLGLRLSKGHVIESHAHSWGQVIFAANGVMQIDAEDSRWVVPPMRCVWVPPDVGHSILMISETVMRTIYINPTSAGGLPNRCKVLKVSGLLREIILECVRLSMLSGSEPTHVHLASVLLDQLAAADEISLEIRLPNDPRAVRLADLISADASNKAPLGELARAVGASPRTLERIFVRETGLSIGRWRQQARLMLAVRLLVEGNSVGEAAFASGYESPSAFIAMFRSETGTTPGQYIRSLRIDA
ncbi:MAG TPA: helix-turn-helix transcriptional regulator [Pyrinomonadaceae bacterium]|nr:helix-turn-helix transcriptional regulator [Pyrinomonadaceae bacterium]HMP64709.1 helix-turn-helix transcriptional regulator [Pyrinomonadaceae bacterium]